MPIELSVPLAQLCTLRVGGPAERFVRAATEQEIVDAVREADDQGLTLHMLGGGSNVVFADDGVDGVTVEVANTGLHVERDGDLVRVRAQAGEAWDPFVALTVAEGWAGVECLSGIPGRVGATPIQNVGAYGQEVAESITRVGAYDRVARARVELDREACGFRYRDSVFKREAASRYVVLEVEYTLRRDGAPSLRYAELARHVETRAEGRTLAAVRAAVLETRRGKSMLLDPGDPNTRSCGSFFLNPIVDRALGARLSHENPDLPTYPTDTDHVKLAAAWLIERAGFAKGLRRGSVGISTAHSLALVCHDGATARSLVDLATTIQRGVAQRFGVVLEPEPRFVGFGPLTNGLPAV